MKKIILLSIMTFLCLFLVGCKNFSEEVQLRSDNQLSQQELDKDFGMKEKCYTYNDEWNNFVKEYYGEECEGSVFYNSNYNSCLGEFNCYTVEGPEGKRYASFNYGFWDVLSSRRLASCQGYDHLYDNNEDSPLFIVLDKSLPDYGDMGCGEYFDYLYDYLH